MNEACHITDRGGGTGQSANSSPRSDIDSHCRRFEPGIDQRLCSSGSMAIVQVCEQNMPPGTNPTGDGLTDRTGTGDHNNLFHGLLRMVIILPQSHVPFMVRLNNGSPMLAAQIDVGGINRTSAQAGNSSGLCVAACDYTFLALLYDWIPVCTGMTADCKATKQSPPYRRRPGSSQTTLAKRHHNDGRLYSQQTTPVIPVQAGIQSNHRREATTPQGI
ncbi:MAG: hypothetical protein Tsb0027_24140 [Wenzhouxiangellaceae bacterium]